MKPCVFVFEFSLDEEDEDGNFLREAYGFLISKEGYSKIQDLVESGEFYNEIVEPIESDFGVHDVSGNSPFDNVEMIGFTTYEIQGPYIKKCMKVWHEKMIELCGAENVSKKVHDLSKMDEFSTAEDYFKILSRNI